MIGRRQTVFNLGAFGLVAALPNDAHADLAALEKAARTTLCRAAAGDGKVADRQTLAMTRVAVAVPL